MGCYEADTWSQKDESYILRRHIVYDKTNDQILIAYPDFQKCWKMHYWSVPMERITSDRAAPYVWKKLGTRHWWSERVAAALRKAVEKVLTGDFDGLRVIEGEVGNYAYR